MDGINEEIDGPLFGGMWNAVNSPHLMKNIARDTEYVEYVKKLERNHEELQTAFLQLTSQFARLQFHIRQLKQAAPAERDALINELDRFAFKDNNSSSGCSSSNINDNNTANISSDIVSDMERDSQIVGDIKRKQHQLIYQLRSQINNLYEIGSFLNDERTQIEPNVVPASQAQQTQQESSIKQDNTANGRYRAKRHSKPKRISQTKCQNFLFTIPADDDK